MEENVTVSVRIKPTFAKNITNHCIKVINKNPAVLLVTDRQLTFHYDNIYSEDDEQEDIYKDNVKRFVGRVKEGYNCTVFAYGQTGTGKSYTMGTSNDVISGPDCGLVTRALRDFLDYQSMCEVQVSFVEIYNEKAYDLLAEESKAPLTLKGFAIQEITKTSVENADEAIQLLKMGTSRRHIGETKQNSKSSRSHAIFSIIYSTDDADGKQVSKLNLVDLAGCESIKKTGNQGSSLHEGININKGLLSLGQVMTALSNNSIHIPYRQSVLTTLLKDSLNKQNFISLIACVSSDIEDFGEILQTLEFSNRVKRMRSKPEVNEFISQFKRDNPRLFVNKNSYETPMKRIKIQKNRIFSEDNSNFDESKLLSSSRISPLREAHQMSYSPLIRKCMEALKEELLPRLEDTIQRSIRKQTEFRDITNKENLPTRLFEDVVNCESETVFKMPQVPVRRSVRLTKGPAEEVSEPQIKTRRSVRLAKRPAEAEVVSEPQNKTRRSVRLKKHNSEAALEDMTNNRRRSVRLQAKKRTSPETCINCRSFGKTSPSTKRAHVVLDILNNGTLREIEKLQTVGPKTAEKLILFRNFKGGFNSIGDLAEMPSWQKKKFENFLSQNFIVKY